MAPEDMALHRVASMPGKGVGCVATSDIAAGTCLMRERPLVSLALSEAGDLHGQLDKVTGEFRSERTNSCSESPP